MNSLTQKRTHHNTIKRLLKVKQHSRFYSKRILLVQGSKSQKKSYRAIMHDFVCKRYVQIHFPDFEPRLSSCS